MRFLCYYYANMEPNITQNPRFKAPILYEAWEWIKVIVIAIIIATIVRHFIIEPFIVEGVSMDPTFKTGHFLIIDRLSYRFHEPRRGDVIVLINPNDHSEYFIKRIIGLPGETVTLENGNLKITSGSTTQEIKEPYIADIHKSFNNAEYNLNNKQYFVMGDNRAESSDSRAWGPVERDLIIGRPMIRLFPLNKITIYPGEYNQN